MSQTLTLAADAQGITHAADMLHRGRLVAFPTETVYGLGGNARDGTAVAGIFAAKGRPSFNPLIVHVPDLATAEEIGVLTAQARRLAHAFWPGPLTLVVPLRSGTGLSGLVTAGLDSVALRVPAAPVAQDLLAAFGGPVAAPSANPSGRISPTRAEHVLAGLDGRIAAVLDGGPCAVGLESTIIGCVDAPSILRPGGADPARIAEVLGHDVAPAPQSEAPTAPGQLASHYAPRKPVRLNATGPHPGELYLGFGPHRQGPFTLSETGDLTQAAAHLFEMLHLLDAKPGTGIAVAPIPEMGLGLAINDRLRRAAAPRAP